MTSTTVPEAVSFDEPLPAGVDPRMLLGGKGAGLAEMRALGLPVPPGFVITTEVCRRYLADGWPASLDAAISHQLTLLEERAGRRFGDSTAPLLVSVRSGAPVSMPGMMDTVLNVGMTAAIRDRLAAESGDRRFADDTWERFRSAYLECVVADEDGGAPEPPADPRAQLRGAIEAVFRSWHSDRARVFRKREGISDDLGTAVTVQAMVFGNLDDRSGTGVVFTRDPATGDPRPYGDYLARAQGEDVVAGTHLTSGLDALQAGLPAVYDALLSALARLERHYRDICDVEFTVSAGELYILQTRIGRRSPLAAVRTAVAMAENPAFPLSPSEAVARVDHATMRAVAEAAAVDPNARALTSGLAVSPGVGVGVLCCDPDRAADLANRGIAVVLARAATSPADVHGMVGASAIVTTLGGVASHAAVVARSWAIPAVTSVANTSVLAAGIQVGDVFVAEGEVVTVDGASGALYLGDQRRAGTATVPELDTLRRWAHELGVEPGTRANEASAEGRDAGVTLLELARTVQLKGLCSPERAAQALFTAEQRIAALLEEHRPLFQETPRGMLLSADGRGWLQEELGRERAALDRAALNGSYERFMELNHEFKRVVSEWQIASASGHSDEQWAQLVAEVAAIDLGLTPLAAEVSAQITRLRGYAPRFKAALEALRAGDASMLASPLKDSYHTVWFEFHEELIGASGRDRATEEAAT
ncbi:MAG: pyruvate, phosphate dikinase [Chloroflexi bacterium]|nr:pyruvate, phosphate dikinase [Chloroflexota bacterium]MDA1147651.1 pyruvate, phosphate dikinase [Chloroflexota bacterium]